MTYIHSKKFINKLFSNNLPEEICSLIYFFARTKHKSVQNHIINHNLKFKINRNDKHLINIFEFI